MIDPTIPTVTLPPAADAARFLAQATFGTDKATIDALAGQDYEAWIDAQKNKPRSLTEPYMQSVYDTIEGVRIVF